MNKLCYCFLLLGIVAKAQLTENFDNTFFYPKWAGDTSKWVIKNGQLQSNSSTASDTLCISTPSTGALQTQWEFYVNLKFNTSGTNYTDVYLTCDNSNLKSNAKNGYFVRIGGSTDEISLFRRKNGTNTKIIDGINSQTNTSNNILKIKVTRNAAHVWTLKRDLTGTGYNYVTEGSATDSTFTTSLYFGFFVRQSTASFHFKHYFDNILIQPIVIDTLAPGVFSAKVVSTTQIDLLFDENVDFKTSQDSANYILNGIKNPLKAVRDAVNPRLIHLTFADAFVDSALNTINISGVEDFDANATNNVSAQFTYYAPAKPVFKDVIINELFPDPSPQVGLPNAEFVELFNASNKSFCLKDWKLADATAETIITSKNTDSLLSGQYLILCDIADTLFFKPYGKVIGLSMPSLNNTEDKIYLRGSNELTVDSVHYYDSWYKYKEKQEGGYTLELINSKASLHCPASENWQAAVDSSGGTPGRINSVNALGGAGLQLLSANIISMDSIVLLFNKAVDTLMVKNTANYTISNSVGAPSKVYTINGMPHAVLLALNASLVAGKNYTIYFNNFIKDCFGNSLSPTAVEVMAPEQALPSDLAINELLLDPLAGGVEFVEIYNRSEKMIDLKSVSIALYDTIYNKPLTQKIITNTTYFIKPGEYIVISENGKVIKEQYHTPNPAGFIDITDMPALNNVSGAICLCANNQIIDYFKYNQNMHFALLSQTKGVSLERINYNIATNEKSNWHSAAQTVGFATPAYQNSQYNALFSQADNIVLPYELFSPNGDGNKDVLTINYHFENSGNVGNIFIYDSKGRLIKTLLKNELLATQGSIYWDGIDDNKQLAPIGIYIIYAEVFDVSGKVQRFKKTSVLAQNI